MKMVGVPAGEALPAVLRAAYDMASLLCLPGMSGASLHVIRAASLYLSLVLHRFAVPFPLFCLAGVQRRLQAPRVGAGCPPRQRQPQRGEDSHGNDIGKTSEEGEDVDPMSPSTAAQKATEAVLQTSFYSGSELQWVDVELAAAFLGVSLADFFEGPQVATQYLQNVLTLASLATAAPVPSVLWHPQRVPNRVAFAMHTLAERRRRQTPVHATQRTSGLSPDHTALVVALELARLTDEAPLAQHLAHGPLHNNSSASLTAKVVADAQQQAQRIGQWLDNLGLYPYRNVYRDAAYFQKSSSPDTAVHAQDALEASLTTLSATTDLAGALAHAEALAASEGGDHRTHHDGEGNTLDEFESTTRQQCYSRIRIRCRPSVIGSAATASVLTTPQSPFAGWMENIFPSPCANALLHVFAHAFHMSPLELADAALRSGLYHGSSNVMPLMREATLRGAFFVMPLVRRISPVGSFWSSAYLCLHSNDRLAFLAVLHQLNDAQNTTRDRAASLTRVLQKILRKHQSFNTYQMNFTLHVVDDAEKHFNGIYFLSSVLADGAVATFTCLRSGRKTISFNARSGTISLCFFREKERVVHALKAHPRGPLLAQLESESAKAVVTTVLGGSGSGSGAEQWANVVRCLDRCGRVRRRMRVPMLASRLDALASIREASAMTTHPIAGAATLLGWGETESVLESPPPVDVLRLRLELQQNMLALPSCALLHGLSENRVVAMYASLVALLEFIESHTQQQVAAMQKELLACRERKQRFQDGLAERRQRHVAKAALNADRREEGAMEMALHVKAEADSTSSDEKEANRAAMKGHSRVNEEEQGDEDDEADDDEKSILAQQARLNTWIEELLDTTTLVSSSSGGSSNSHIGGFAGHVGQGGGGSGSQLTSPSLAPSPVLGDGRFGRVQLAPMVRPITATPTLSARGAPTSAIGSSGVTITTRRADADHTRRKQTHTPSRRAPGKKGEKRKGQDVSPLRQQPPAGTKGGERGMGASPPLRALPTPSLGPAEGSSRPGPHPLKRASPPRPAAAQTRGGGSPVVQARRQQQQQQQRKREKELRKRRCQGAAAAGRRFPLDSSSSSSSSEEGSEEDESCASTEEAVPQRHDPADNLSEPPPLQLAVSTVDADLQLPPHTGGGDKDSPPARSAEDTTDDEDDSSNDEEGREDKSSDDDDDDYDGFEKLQEAQRRATQQQRARQAAVAAEEERRHRLVREHLRVSLPTYEEVLLGLSGFAAYMAGTAGGRDDAGGLARAQAQRSHPRHQQRGHGGVGDGEEEDGHQHRPSQVFAAAAAAAPGEKGGVAAAEAAMTVLHSFNLFSAEECRRRLHRMLAFTKHYQRRRAELCEQAMKGHLLPLATAPPLTTAAAASQPKRPREASASGGHTDDEADGSGTHNPRARRASPGKASPPLGDRAALATRSGSSNSQSGNKSPLPKPQRGRGHADGTGGVGRPSSVPTAAGPPGQQTRSPSGQVSPLHSPSPPPANAPHPQRPTPPAERVAGCAGIGGDGTFPPVTVDEGNSAGPQPRADATAGLDSTAGAPPTVAEKKRKRHEANECEDGGGGEVAPGCNGHHRSGTDSARSSSPSPSTASSSDGDAEDAREGEADGDRHHSALPHGGAGGTVASASAAKNESARGRISGRRRRRLEKRLESKQARFGDQD